MSGFRGSKRAQGLLSLRQAGAVPRVSRQKDKDNNNKMKKFILSASVLGLPLLASASDLSDAAADISADVTTFAGLIAGIAAAMVGAIVAVKFIKKLKGAV
jgi:hypothetical protein